MSSRIVSDPRIQAAQVVVEATNWEQNRLWLEYRQTWKWDWDAGSGAVDIGTVGGFTVAIRLKWATIDGVLVMFWDPCSRVVDHDACHDWLARTVPAYAAGRDCDAATFKDVFSFGPRTP